MNAKEKAIKYLTKRITGLSNAYQYQTAKEAIDIALKEKDKIIQAKDRAYSAEIRRLNNRIDKLSRFETARIKRVKFDIAKEVAECNACLLCVKHIKKYKLQ